MARALFFGVDAAGNDGLWVTNGSAAATNEIAAFSNPGDLVVFNEHEVLFATEDLWVTNGTTAGTHEITVNGAAFEGINPIDLTVFNNEVLFSGLNASQQRGLWVTDGT